MEARSVLRFVAVVAFNSDYCPTKRAVSYVSSSYMPTPPTPLC